MQKSIVEIFVGSIIKIVEICERKAWIWRKYNIQVSEKAEPEELMI